MMFQEVAPYENLDLKCFRSLPEGRWEAGILKMGFGKGRVRIAPTASLGFVPIDYWGGDQKNALILLGFLLAILNSIPESIEEEALVEMFPSQADKDTGPMFWQDLFNAAVKARQIYGDFQE
jgi:hypothetical protein